MDDLAIEKKIRKKGLNAPRLTPELVQGMVGGTQYYRFPGTSTIVCCITLTNGFTVTGESSCVSSANFDEEIGKEVAFNKAKDKIWVFEGYLLNHIINKLKEES